MTNNPLCTWDLTLSNKLKDEDISKGFTKIAKKWTFQEEKGEKEGNLHFQCRISLKEKIRKNGLMKLLKDSFGWDKIHPDQVSVTSNENRDNMFYVMKENTRERGPWSDTDEIIYVPRQIREIKKLRDWQQTVIDDLAVWNTRTINVVIDTRGNNGKSILCSWVRCYKLGRILPALNDAKDLMRATYDMPTATAYLIDLPRALNKNKLSEMYSAIEQIKSGYCYDDRYNFREKIFDCPNIWVFTNHCPDTELLSADRWKLWEIKDGVLVRLRQGETPTAPSEVQEGFYETPNDF